MNQAIPGNNLTKIEIHAKCFFNSAKIILGVYHNSPYKVNNKIVKNYFIAFSTRSPRLLIAFTLYSTKVIKHSKIVGSSRGHPIQSQKFAF